MIGDAVDRAPGQRALRPNDRLRRREGAHAASAADDRVVEFGTRYGFQTALLSSSRLVVSAERHASLSEAARRNLARAGIANATLVVGDGWAGIRTGRRSIRLVVSAAADEVFRALRDQLEEGGRLIMPTRAGVADECDRSPRR